MVNLPVCFNASARPRSISVEPVLARSLSMVLSATGAAVDDGSCYGHVSQRANDPLRPPGPPATRLAGHALYAAGETERGNGEWDFGGSKAGLAARLHFTCTRPSAGGTEPLRICRMKTGSSCFNRSGRSN